MSKRLTQKEKKFADTFIDTGNGTKSALVAYDTEDENTAAVIASRTLSKDKVQNYIHSKAEKAAEIVFTIAQHGDSDGVRLAASKDILDRAGFKPTEKQVTINVDATYTEKTRELGTQLLQRQRD